MKAVDCEGLKEQALRTDELFREAGRARRQWARDSVDDGITRGVLQVQVDNAQERLQDARQRNAELSQRAQMLQQLLISKRAEYSWAAFTGSADGEQDEPAAKATEASASPADSESPLVKVLSDLESWEARLPQVRKQPNREKLLQTLRDAGLDEAEPDFAPVLPETTDLLELAEAAAAIRNHRPGQDTEAAALRAPYSWEHLAISPRAFLDDSRSRSGSASKQQKEPFWGERVTFGGHLDGVRSVAAHTDALLSCGEDGLIKAWDLSFFNRKDWKLYCQADMDPYVTYRGHSSAVLSLACCQEERLFFSGGQDGNVLLWQLVMPADYDAYSGAESSADVVPVRRLSEHAAPVWALAVHSDTDLLASAGADGTVLLWDIHGSASKPGSRGRLDCGTGGHAPTSLAWASHAGSALLVAGLTSSQCMVFDAEHQKFMHALDASSAVTSVACHVSEDLLVSGHSDGSARLFSPLNGRELAQLPRHSDSVTSVALDPWGGHEVVTACHDGCLRIFDLRTRRLLQQLQLHKAKYDEAMHCVCHGGDRLVTAGADARIFVLGCSE